MLKIIIDFVSLYLILKWFRITLYRLYMIWHVCVLFLHDFTRCFIIVYVIILPGGAWPPKPPQLVSLRPLRTVGWSDGRTVGRLDGPSDERSDGQQWQSSSYLPCLKKALKRDAGGTLTECYTANDGTSIQAVVEPFRVIPYNCT